MNLTPSHNLFMYTSDPRLVEEEIQIGENNTLHTVEGIYNARKLRLLVELYITLLVGEYLLSFVQLPFEEIHERPSACILHSTFSFVCFAACVAILPFQCATIPNLQALKLHFLSVALQTFYLVLAIVVVVSVLQVDFMYVESINTLEETDNVSVVDMTMYVKSVSSIMLSCGVLGWALCLTNCILYYRGYYRLINRLDKRCIPVASQLAKGLAWKQEPLSPTFNPKHIV